MFLKNIFPYFFLISQVSLASTGVILKADNTIDFYENGEFIRQIIQLPSSHYLISYTGDFFFHAKYFSEDKKYSLHSCNILTAKCMPIVTPELTGDIVSISFSDNGFGLVARKDNKIDIYENSKYIKTFPIEGREIKDIVFIGDFYYVLQIKDSKYSWVSSEIKKCYFELSYCMPILEINQQITGISFNENDEGYALTKDGYVLYFYKGNYLWQKKFLNYYADNIFNTDQGLYIRQQVVEKNNDINQPNKYTANFFICHAKEIYCEKILNTNSFPVYGSFK